MSPDPSVLAPSARTEMRPRQRASVTYVTLDGEAVLYNEHDGAIHLLNPTATVVWQCLDGASSITELIADLAEAFAVATTDVEQELATLLSDLTEKGLIDVGSVE